VRHGRKSRRRAQAKVLCSSGFRRSAGCRPAGRRRSLRPCRAGHS